MTDLQSRMLEYIEMYDRRMGFPPTRREIGDRFERSTSIVNYNLASLEREGALEIARGKARGIRIRRRVPVEVQA